MVACPGGGAWREVVRDGAIRSGRTATARASRGGERSRSKQASEASDGKARGAQAVGRSPAGCRAAASPAGSATCFGASTPRTRASSVGRCEMRSRPARLPHRAYAAQRASASGTSAATTRGGRLERHAPRSRPVVRRTVKRPPSAPLACRAMSSSRTTLAIGSCSASAENSLCEVDVMVRPPPLALARMILLRPAGP